jgi:hypothetical protein
VRAAIAGLDAGEQETEREYPRPGFHRFRSGSSALSQSHGRDRGDAERRACSAVVDNVTGDGSLFPLYPFRRTRTSSQRRARANGKNNTFFRTTAGSSSAHRRRRDGGHHANQKGNSALVEELHRPTGQDLDAPTLDASASSFRRALRSQSESAVGILPTSNVDPSGAAPEPRAQQKPVPLSYRCRLTPGPRLRDPAESQLPDERRLAAGPRAMYQLTPVGDGEYGGTATRSPKSNGWSSRIDRIFSSIPDDAQPW